MKKDIKDKSKYVLNVEETEKLIKHYIAPEYSEFVFTVRKSENSNSIYIEIEDENKHKIIRISDHPHETHLSSCVVGPRTKKRTVISYISNSLEALRKRRLSDILNNL